MNLRELYSYRNRLKIFFFFNFMANGVFNPYLGLYLFKNGLDGKQVALLLGIMPLAKVFVQPAWALLCDHFRIHKSILSLSLLSLALTSTLFFFNDRFDIWIILVILFSIFEAPYVPLGSTISLDYLESINQSNEFGNLRLWGSLGFVIASLLIGNLFFDRLLRSIPLLFAVLVFITAIIVCTLPENSGSQSIVKGGQFKVSHLNGSFVLFLIGMTFIGFSSGIVNQYFVVYMDGIQANGVIIGLAVALMALPEIPLMAKAARFIQTYGIKISLLVGLYVFPLRFFLYTIIKNPLYVLPVQILHGVTIVSILVVGATYVSRLTPLENRALGQGLFSTAYGGIGMSLGLFTAGLIYNSYGISAVWILSTFMSIIGCLIIYITFKLEPIPTR